jgi:hypothetical protein
MEDLSKRNVIEELLMCALNKTQSLRASGYWRGNVLGKIIDMGYLQAANPANVRREASAATTSRILNEGAKVILTEKGKQLILELNPDDFKKEAWFPLPRDVVKAQTRLKNEVEL